MIRTLAFGLLLLLLAACGDNEAVVATQVAQSVAQTVAALPTDTPIPPTATPIPPTATPIPPTATPIPPTATPVPPTATRIPPTATRIPPTATRIPPTATAISLKSTRVLPTQTPTAAPAVVTLTLTRNANLRAGPGTNYPAVAAGQSGETYPVQGQAQAGDGVWYQFERAQGQFGWVRADFVRLSEPNAVIAVVTDLPPTPEAPPTPVGPSGVLLYSNANLDAEQWELWEYNFNNGKRRFLFAWRTEVAFNRTGSQIAYYQWGNSSEAGVWVMGADYSGGRRVVPLGDVAYPSFSPDSSRLALMGDRIYIANSDGSGLRALIEGEYPAWSPTDNRIVFRGCFGADCGIWLTDADAGGRSRLTSGGSDGQPAWAPNGQKLAFISQEEGNFEIYTINANSSGRTRLTYRPASDGLPVWSPDGNWIAWRSDEGGVWGVWVMRADGSGQRRLFDAPVLPVWFWEKMAWRR
ncbi:MAG: PD40 domain-containing protein [Caldilineales bacterium]|nr:PD40 domain-containing protein [Caldilineales bacterium]